MHVIFDYSHYAVRGDFTKLFTWFAQPEFHIPNGNVCQQDQAVAAFFTKLAMACRHGTHKFHIK